MNAHKKTASKQLADKEFITPLYSRGRRAITVWALICVCLMPLTATAQTKNGFDLSNSLIDVNQIFHGGPPRDGIPSIDQPKFIAVDAVDYLRDDDIVIGFQHNGTARAYPNRILIWHEIVNDNVGGKAVAITYCPLCGTSIVFERESGGRVRSFGVSGLLYQSDVLMYDRETESLWSQLAMQAVSGESAGQALTWLASEHLTWQAWRAQYPDGEVLSTDTGFHRDYNGNAYASYFASDEILFPVPKTRQELANKAWVLGVLINGEAKAYPLDALPNATTIQDTVGGKRLSIHYNAAARHPQITDADNRRVPSVVSFWFAWQAFYPNSGLWMP